MITKFEALTAQDPLAAAAETIVRTTQAEIPVLGPQGNVEGFVTRKSVIEGIAKEQQASPVTDWMAGSAPTVRSGASLEQALDALNQPGVPAVSVTDETGRLLGFITRENLGEWIALSVKKE